MKSLKYVLLFLLIMPLLVGPIREVKSSSLYGWTSASNPVENAAGALTSVSMIDSRDGWAVGPAGKTLHWNGEVWNLVTSPSSYTLQSIFMTNPSNRWFVGEDITYWDGSELGLISDPLTAGYYRSVFMLSTTEGWAVGSEWVQVGPGANEQRPRIIRYGSIVPEATTDVELYIYPDNIRLRDKNLQVAILGSPTFDVKEISPETINIGGVSVARRGPTKAPELSISYRDVNSDSHMDLVSSFSIPELVLGGVLNETTTSLTLTATLLDGTPIEGTDTVEVVRR